MKNDPGPGDAMRIVSAAHLLVFVLCCLDTFIDEVLHTIKLPFHATYDNRKKSMADYYYFHL